VTEKTGLDQIVSQPTRGQNVLDRVFVSSPVYYTPRSALSCQSCAATIKLSSPMPTSQGTWVKYLQRTHIDQSLPDFDTFYDMAISLLEQFYPERTVTPSSRDSYFVTPLIKAKLRRKNRLMLDGRTEEASALAQRIGRDIASRTSFD